MECYNDVINCDGVCRKIINNYLKDSKMKKFLSLLIVGLVMGLSGCGDKAEEAAVVVDEHAGHDHSKGGHSHDDDAKGDKKEGDTHEHKEGEDHDHGAKDGDKSTAGAEVCPVSNTVIGSVAGMDPFTATVNGQEIKLCCKGCLATVEANPEKYLKKK